MAEEQKKDEKSLDEMSAEEIQNVRKEIADEEFSDAPAEVKTSPEVLATKPEVIPETEPVKSDEDSWTGVNPALRKTLENLSEKVSALDTIPTRLKQTESRLGAIQNEFYAAKKVAETIPKTPTKEEIEKAATEKENWEELKVEYPDWATAIDARLARMTKGADEVQQEQKGLADRQDEFVGQVKNEFAIMTETFEKKLLNFKYPDWEKTIETPEYQKWITEQSKEIQQLTFSSFAQDAAIVLDGFSKAQNVSADKKTPAEIAAEKRQRLKQSVSLEGTKTIPPKSEADMTDEELRAKVAKEVWAD